MEYKTGRTKAGRWSKTSTNRVSDLNPEGEKSRVPSKQDHGMRIVSKCCRQKDRGDAGDLQNPLSVSGINRGRRDQSIIPATKRIDNMDREGKEDKSHHNRWN